MSNQLYKTKMRQADINAFWLINGTVIAIVLSFFLSENESIKKSV